MGYLDPSYVLHSLLLPLSLSHRSNLTIGRDPPLIDRGMDVDRVVPKLLNHALRENGSIDFFLTSIQCLRPPFTSSL